MTQPRAGDGRARARYLRSGRTGVARATRLAVVAARAHARGGMARTGRRGGPARRRRGPQSVGKAGGCDGGGAGERRAASTCAGDTRGAAAEWRVDAEGAHSPMAVLRTLPVCEHGATRAVCAAK